MKRYLMALLSGIVLTLIFILFMLKVTMNFQVLIIVGSAIFFIAGYLNSGSKNHYLITAGSIGIFYLSFFAIVVLEELPELWYFIPVYFLSILLGIFIKKHRRNTLIACSLMIFFMLFAIIKLVPNDLEKRLTKERFDPLPEFTLENMDGSKTEIKDLKGKIVVLDFFGTWCKPCILELKELDKVKDAFSKDDIEFFVINADQGNDTPEKFESFINKNNYTFNFAYDHETKIFKQLKMHHLGLPTLLIIDKEQNIRLQHVGYNPGESNFTRNMIEFIGELNE